MGPFPNLSGLFNDFRGIFVITSKYDFLSDQLIWAPDILPKLTPTNQSSPFPFVALFLSF
ncbi:unnamed protein product [Arabidopsis lyrata]|uniref:Expressed protein n=1 Tax=Arabidopsis lyrata subsp. lyrata TaxID=81972 RepID=D7LD05_ARALL|nr:expressed protein [Arabidopsis lyrata subsp. lyrata]CAH8264347.1 unnamed protein product [Arabidopsis lyrata]